jgi:hypothetical protein
MLPVGALRSQDVLVACKLYSFEISKSEWTYAGLAASVGLSAGEAHNSYRRCRSSLLLTPGGQVAGQQLVNLLTVAAPLVFYAARGGLASGMPTATWSPMLKGNFPEAPGALPNVWPCQSEGKGMVRGESVDPIYPTAPEAAGLDPVVYELLALVDVMRLGGRQEREVAGRLISKTILGRDGQSKGERR